MDHDKIHEDKYCLDEVMLPGFRFHPTDEELVGFYLRRKIQQRPISIELIKHLDIYKYDPWDLPRLAAMGDKEWYFYCPRDRKYRNSPRPNRVSKTGFWKATGTDRPIHSSISDIAGSSSSKCIIGLKKSLVFYKGRAAKGIKTDWMMHEFRLPAAVMTMEETINLPSDSLAICRIFKKTSSAVPQRATPHYSWPCPSNSNLSQLASISSNTNISNNMNGSRMMQLISQSQLDDRFPNCKPILYHNIAIASCKQPFELSVPSDSDHVALINPTTTHHHQLLPPLDLEHAEPNSSTAAVDLYSSMFFSVPSSTHADAIDDDLVSDDRPAAASMTIDITDYGSAQVSRCSNFSVASLQETTTHVHGSYSKYISSPWD
ncbi:hypothetical protein Dimus_014919 [Dionaea muscipula]